MQYLPALEKFFKTLATFRTAWGRDTLNDASGAMFPPFSIPCFLQKIKTR
jgi:hypothetical protein